MDLIFACLNKLKKHEIKFLQAKKKFKAWMSFFGSLKKLKKHGCNFLGA